MKKYAPQIDTFRLLAMLLVFLNHALFIPQAGGMAKQLYDIYAQWGQYAVQFFIVLSGMLAAYTYHPFALRDRQCYFSYAQHKALRLFPLHWVCMLLFLPLSFCFYESSRVWQALPLSACLLQSLSVNAVMPINGPSWTISVLLICFLATPVLLYVIQRFVKTGRLLLLLLFLTIVADGLWQQWLGETFPQDPWYYHSSLHSRVFTYLTGLLLGLMLKKVPELPFLQKHGSVCEWFVLVMLCLAVGRGAFCRVFPNMAIVLFLYVFWGGYGCLSRWCSMPVLRALSRLSFAFYMVHFLFINLALYLAFFVWHNFFSITIQEAVAMSIGCLFLSLLAAWGAHLYIEKKLTEKLKQYLKIK